MKTGERLARSALVAVVLAGIVGGSSLAATAQTGTIALNGTAQNVNVGTSGENASFTFSGTAGQGVSVVLTNSTFPAPGGCPAVIVSLVRPNTTQASSVSTCSDNAFLDTFTLDATGTWTVLVDPQGSSTGTATLQAYDASDATHAITVNGAPVNVVTKVPGQNGSYSFSGTSGTEIAAQLSTSTIPGCTTISLVRPDGSSLGTGTTGCTATIFYDAHTLDQTGTWALKVDPQGTGFGTAQLNAYDATDQLRPITLNGGAVNVNITQPGQNSTFTFGGTSGQGVSAQLTEGTITGCYDLYLVRPNGSQFGTVVNSCTGTAVLDAQTLDANGTWALVVDPEGAAKGQAQLQAFDTADQVLPITLNGAPRNVNLGPGQLGAYTFTGAVGQQVSAAVTNSTFSGCTAFVLLLRRPDYS